ncbi:MAG: hypothetical protein EAZ31_09330 [Cytophagia bacterium]|nr:MAG: hypothetical protein EAY69_09555 [Cytophagales bacterium]TAG39303.1 MAG: hypothetical protein EAZ31_09330 [Cytophagia bacterium]
MKNTIKILAKKYFLISTKIAVNDYLYFKYSIIKSIFILLSKKNALLSKIFLFYICIRNYK